jgi:GNAT superfamily N-acetyltransferase
VIQELTFPEIKLIWQSKLWVGRTSIIEPESVINIQGELDIHIAAVSQPTFFGYFADGKIVGVLSSHFTKKTESRIRGLWVDEERRRQGIGAALLKHTETENAKRGVETLWMMSRTSNTQYYTKLGYVARHRLFQYEFGPHDVMIKELNKQNIPTETL